MPAILRHNTAKDSFEIEIEGQTVFCECRRVGQILSLTHVETPLGLRGRGAAGLLMQSIAEMARAEGLKLDPICSYAEAWLQKHSEFHDLMA